MVRKNAWYSVRPQLNLVLEYELYDRVKRSPFVQNLS